MSTSEKLNVENTTSITVITEKSRSREIIRISLACTINILSSIGIVFVNKYIFTKCKVQTITLTTIHMATTFTGLYICSKLNTFTPKAVPLPQALQLSLAFCSFIIFTNLSLEYNTIGTYQIFKSLPIVVVVLISWYFYKTKYSFRVISTLVPLMVGVCLHSINDIKLTLFGTTISLIGALSVSLYQIWIGERMKELEMNSQQLLYYQAGASAIILLPFIIIFESFPVYSTIEQQQNAFFMVALSAATAFIVNLSVYWVIGDTSALSYCMIGHLKTILIILGGFLYFDENINLRQWIGIALTLFSSISYTIVRMREQKNNENQ